jgi:hypothetical protein
MQFGSAAAIASSPQIGDEKKRVFADVRGVAATAKFHAALCEQA